MIDNQYLIAHWNMTNKKTFEKMMEKLDLEIGRYNGFVATDSFETMELRYRLSIEIAHSLRIGIWRRLI